MHCREANVSQFVLRVRGTDALMHAFQNNGTTILCVQMTKLAIPLAMPGGEGMMNMGAASNLRTDLS